MPRFLIRKIMQGFLVAALAFGGSRFVAADMLPIPINDLVSGSDHIVIGQVQKIHGERLTNKTGDKFIVSIVTITVQENLKSQLPPVIKIKSLGGTIGNVSNYLSISPIFHVGEQVLLFLEERSGVLVPYQFQQGKYTVENDLILDLDGNDRPLDQFRESLRNGRFGPDQPVQVLDIQSESNTVGKGGCSLNNRAFR